MKMENTSVHLRMAVPDDAKQLLDIYAYYVEKTAISFEYTVPSVEEFRGRINSILEKFPYLVAECNDEILGYVYARPFVGRAAYDWSVETTIYLKQDKRKMGLGKRLYEALETILKAQNILNVNACIGYPEVEDEYLTKNSVQFHRHLGYQMVGEFHNSGFKFGRWYNMVWMEKMLGEHGSSPQPVKYLPELDADVFKILE